MAYSLWTIEIACNHAGLTHCGGVYFFHEFLRVLHSCRTLERFSQFGEWACSIS
jgi:hypothetical protein